MNSGVNTVPAVLGDSAAAPRYIETLARRGYRFVGPTPNYVGVATEAEPESAATDLEIQPHVPPKPAPPPEPFIDDPLPRAPRPLVRVLFGLAQLMYLIFYLGALMHMEQVFATASVLVPGSGRAVWVEVVMTAAIGIPTRLYLLAAVTFDYQPLGRKFFRLFPLIFVLDWMWALAPFLIASKIGNGLAIAACGALLYLPFSARTLIRMGYKTRSAA